MAQAARTVDLPSDWDITNTASTVRLGDGGTRTVSTEVVQVTGTWTGTLIFQGTLGTPGTGTYATAGYTTLADPGTVVTTGLFTANGVYFVRTDGLSDLRIKVSIAGSGTPVIMSRPLGG